MRRKAHEEVSDVVLDAFGDNCVPEYGVYIPP